MANPYFRFKQFTVYHHQCAMKVTTDACVFGAWCAARLQKDFKKFDTLLDIGTGTGLLSLMVAQQVQAQIDAVEIDEKAAQQAQENAAASPWSKNINIIHGNLFETLLQPQYDVIISNPPFYEKEWQSASKERNVALHSEALPLDDLFGFLQQKVASDGTFFLLLPYKRHAAIKTLFHKWNLHLHSQVVVHPSLQHAPFRLMLQGGKYSIREPEHSTLFIAEQPGLYTPQTIELLKDYYLYL
jgi:tRNA1Val (adenine37-N6)-methyltransferase